MAQNRAMPPSSQLAPPRADDYAPFYSGYVHRVIHGDVLATLQSQEQTVAARFGAIPADRERFRYATGKWSLRQVLGHLADAERIFGGRALALARGEQQALPGFDENAYVAAAPFEEVPLADLLAEFLLVRRSHSLLLSHLTPADWDRRGTVNGQAMALRAMPFIMAGHVHHHLEILAARYGV